MTGREEQLDALARDVLRLSRNTLLVNLRFLDAALSQFTLLSGPWALATDGQHIYYDPRAVLRSYRAEREGPVRDYLHMVLHCVFRHNLVNTLLDRACWDLACDLAVEAVIQELDLPCAAARRQAAQRPLLQSLRDQGKRLTAETLYRYFLDQRLPPAELQRLRGMVQADDHAPWYLPPQSRPGLGRADAAGGNAGHLSSPGAGVSQAALSRIWKEIAARMQTDLETFSRLRGDRAGNLVQNLRAVTRETYDYASFLRKFAVLGEAMKINDNEFDYIFYTYGMKLFGNLPLIEPLEYQEVRRIREFVIAIDTSGSVQGELVQRFVQKTYNILQQEESFFKKINLHILQCDAQIQEDVKITSREEFDRYLRTMRLSGFGGTDFRPVFAYVEELRRAKEFRNLKGLIYFTDGYGVFPAQKPDYPTAFVFLRDGYELPEVPSWAIRLVLEPEEL